MDFLPSAFDALKSTKQFMIYVLIPSKTRAGKTDKFPIDYRTGQVSNAHDPNIWLSADAAINEAKRFGNSYGVGFVFTEQDPFWFLDIDECLEPCGTKWSPIALSLLAAFPGAAVEVSSSGQGLHIIGSGRSPTHSCRNKDLKLEFYTSGRFVALTGINAGGSVALDCSVVLPWLVENYFPPASHTGGDWKSMPWNTEAVSEWNGNADDNELLDRALKSNSAQSAFGKTPAFKDLWNAEATVLAIAYPPSEGHLFNQSYADLALARHLAFWTGNNCERMRRLMLRSALVREKWNRVDYLPRTIQTACGRQKEWLQDKKPQSLITEDINHETPRAIAVNGTTFLTIAQQIDIFAGCVYVCDDHRVLIPGGYMLNPERFRVMFGGYSMPMDTGNERVSRNAWEVFTESQAFRSPRADSSCFRPDITPGTIIRKDGQSLVNVYWPVVTPRKRGDVSRFLRHRDLLFPDPRDQEIIISYMAGLVQFKGIKFQWCPLIQGVEGNGKTLFTRCVAFAIGNRYSHFPKASEIASKFNDWQYGKIFIGVEDVYFPDSRNEIIETLKPMITGERLEIEPKGGAKLTRDLCCNYILNTNHKDGLRKTRNDRRFAPFYTAQQTLDDLKRCGMDADYFSAMYGWLRNQDGFSMVCEYLNEYQIPAEFGLACLQDRAPITSTTEAAIEQGRGSIEQEILEAIGEGLIGFKNGWVSSMALDKLLTRLNANRRIPLNKRRDLMQVLGYDWHPGLKDGRLNNVVLPDGGKPRLYIINGHKHTGLLGGGEIAKAYSDDQK